MIKIKRLLDILSGAVALLSMGPVLAYLDLPLLLIALLAIPLGFWCDRRQYYLLPTWLATVTALIGMAFYAMQITRAEVAIPVVHAMIVLLSVRLLTPKEGRDYLQIFVLALFILAGSSLIHLEIGFVVYLVLLIFGVTLGLVILTVHVTDKNLTMTRPDLYRLIRIGLILPAVSLLLMAVFFVVLPRTQHPLWNFLNPSTKAEVGLSETVQPGSFSQITGVKSLAFRAKGPELAPEDRYWRALVLNRPEQGRWVRGEPPAERTSRVEGPAPILFEMYPEPRTDRYLVTLDRPTLVSGIRHSQTVDQMYLSRNILDHRLRFEMRASPGGRLGVAGPIDLEFYLQPPENVSARMRQIALAIRSSNKETVTRLDALASFFRELGLEYAQDDLPSGPDPIDSFLFDKKRGYCEFFASAYTTLARLAGIPARLVGGYYGGDYNPMGGYYLVTEDTAHVWAEVYRENSWQRVDPSQWATNASTTLGARNLSQLHALRQLIDSLNYHWVQAIVVFDLHEQIGLFRNAGKSLRGLRSFRLGAVSLPVVIGLLAGAAVLIVSLMVLRRKSQEARLLDQFRVRLRKRYGREVLKVGVGLAEIGELLDNDDCRKFASIYYGAVFRDRALNHAEVAQLKNLLKRV